MPITNNPIPLGKVTVTTAGTPVSVLSNFSSDAEYSKLHANKVFVRALPTNAGNIYVGYSGMNKSTLAGVLDILPPGQPWGATENVGLNVIDVSALYVDADNDSEAALVSAHIR